MTSARAALLVSQNKELAKEVERLRSRLTMTQILNALPQVFVPSSSTVHVKNGTDSSIVEQVKKSGEQTSVQCAAEGSIASGGNAKPKKEKPAPKQGSAQSGEPAAAEKVDISRLDIRIGKIMSAAKHPDADNLYVEEVSFGGDAKKTVVSGLAKHIPLEQMQNRVAIFLCNLKPAKLKGILSEAMVMCANKDGVVEIVDPPEGSQPGDRVTVLEFPGEPDAQLNPKKNIWEQVMPDLRLNGEGIASYKGIPWCLVGRSGVCKCPSLKDAQIK